MKKLKLYIDTSAIGYLEENEELYRKDKNAMLALWNRIINNEFVVVISELTLDELNANQNTAKLKALTDYLAQIEYTIVETGSVAEHIANLVKINGMLIADKHKNDRLHIGTAIENDCDIIVSMNFKHLVNVRTIRGVRAISTLEGYNTIDIIQPIAMVAEEMD
ncbi:MAG: PIN domain-containing protein [Defluviitaleaceae bacterium]|nr:PIN domain-containing protein [Defluviitaleaceae bacterium]